MEVRKRFKGLDLIDRVPDELWNEVRDIVQETGIKTIPMEKKSKKAKWLSGEALQIAVKRREVKEPPYHTPSLLLNLNIGMEEMSFKSASGTEQVGWNPTSLPSLHWEGPGT